MPQRENSTPPFEIAGFDATDLAGLAPGVRSADVFRTVPIEQLSPDPSNARRRLDPGELEELAQSIGEVGIVEPLLVVETGPNAYQVRSGERRLRAARMAGLGDVPVVVRKEVDPVSAVVVNLQRSDLGVFELADALGALVDAGTVGQADLARRIGKSRSYLSELLSLRRLPEDVRTRAETSGSVDLRALADLARVHDRLGPRARAVIAEAPVLTRAVVAEAQALLPGKGSPPLPAGVYLRLRVGGRSVLVAHRLQDALAKGVALADPVTGERVDPETIAAEFALVRFPPDRS
jgi:ParB family chromosome partitioning protein